MTEKNYVYKMVMIKIYDIIIYIFSDFQINFLLIIIKCYKTTLYNISLN
jgi:hypothetical protein